MNAAYEYNPRHVRSVDLAVHSLEIAPYLWGTEPQRLITLYIRTGMDEGRHSVANHTVLADDALAASARVSDWMREWCRSLDSVGVDA